MVKRCYSPARTQAVGIDLGTRRAACFISVRNTVEFTVVISLWHSSAGLRTVDALSIAGLLWQSTRNTYMDSCLSLMTILRDYMRLNIDSLFGLISVYMTVYIREALYPGRIESCFTVACSVHGFCFFGWFINTHCLTVYFVLLLTPNYCVGIQCLMTLLLVESFLLNFTKLC